MRRKSKINSRLKYFIILFVLKNWFILTSHNVFVNNNNNNMFILTLGSRGSNCGIPKILLAFSFNFLCQKLFKKISSSLQTKIWLINLTIPISPMYFDPSWCLIFALQLVFNKYHYAGDAWSSEDKQ